MLSIVIVNYNVREFLEHALVSLRSASRGLRCEVIVVDNASDDGSVEMIRKKFPSVHLIASGENLGFAKANNIALRRAQGEFILLINPDTLVQEDTLRTMVSFMREHPEVGLAGCKILNPDGTLQLACRRSYPTPWVAFTKIVGLSSMFPSSQLLGRYNLTYLNENASYSVDAVSGSFMMVRRDVVDKVGGLDEAFFMYGEDLDWCYRIREAGWMIWYVHETQIIHYKGESTKRSNIDEIRTFYAAMHQFVRKHFRHSALTVAILRLSIAMVTLGAWFRMMLRPMRDAAVDAVIVVGSLLAGEYLRRGELFLYPSYAYPAVFLIPAAIVLSFQMMAGVYSTRRMSTSRAFMATASAFVLITALTAIFKDFAFSRWILVIAGTISSILIPAWRLFVWGLGKRHAEGRPSAFGKRTVIVGTNEQARALIKRLHRRAGTGYEIVGILGLTHKQLGETFEGIPVIGTLFNVTKVVTEHRVTDLIVAPEALSYAQILSLTAATRRMLAVHLVPGTMEVIVGKASVDRLEELPLVEISYNLARTSHRFWKRAADLVIAVLLLLLVSPILYIRHGFRTTAMPAFVRGLPKVVKGLWSLVGPPQEAVKDQGLFLGRPGLTGLVQLQNGLSNDEAEQFNLYYARNQSFALDLEILLKTWLRR